MRLESALLTVLASVVAVAALAGAAFLMRVTRRAGHAARQREIALADAAVAVRRGLPRARAELDRASRSIEHMERVTRSIGDRMEGWIPVMRQGRADIEHLRARRLLPVIRSLRVAGIAARVAVLWR